MITVHRLHIRPKGGRADPATSFAYCQRHAVLGLGWGIPDSIKSLRWKDYLASAGSVHPGDPLSQVRYLHDHIDQGDLVWTRDARGDYFLARVNSGWSYINRGRETAEADIYNVIRCSMHRVPPDTVPGKVIACFRPARAVQPITAKSMRQYSATLWYRLSGEPPPGDLAVPRSSATLLDFLDDQTTEDLVLIYLQTLGWMVIPSSRKSYTMAYEYVLRHRDGATAIVQVKTGNTPVELAGLRGFAPKAFAFQSSGIYQGERTPDVECLEPEQLVTFAIDNRQLLPDTVSIWVDELDASGAV